MRSFSNLHNRRIKRTRPVFLVCVIFFLVPETGYAMQPPPRPLNIVKLRVLISEADVIAVGKIGTVKESESVDGVQKKKSIEVVLSIEKLLKGEVPGTTVVIKETCPIFQSPISAPKPIDEGEPKRTIIRLTSGPSCYHGRYKQGSRIVVLLEKTDGKDDYKPLGSGTYDKHLCEFPIENDGIKTFYFRFAADLVQYVASEEKFIGLIKSLIDSNSEKGDE